MSELQVYELVDLDPEELSIVEEPAVEDAVFLIKKSADSTDTDDDGADTDTDQNEDRKDKQENTNNTEDQEIDKAQQPKGYYYGYPGPGGYISPKAIIAFLQNAAKATDDKEKKEKIEQIIKLMKEVFVSKDESMFEALVERMDKLESAIEEIKGLLKSSEVDKSEGDSDSQGDKPEEGKEPSPEDKEIIELTGELKTLIESGKLTEEEIEIFRACVERLQSE